MLTFYIFACSTASGALLLALAETYGLDASMLRNVLMFAALWSAILAVFVSCEALLHERRVLFRIIRTRARTIRTNNLK
jgi:hypothetical protein